jgi:hypothetical protein
MGFINQFITFGGTTLWLNDQIFELASLLGKSSTIVHHYPELPGKSNAGTISRRMKLLCYWVYP